MTVQVIHVFGCPACGWHDWQWHKEDSKGHDCPKGYPSGGIYRGPWVKQATPKPQLRSVA